MKSLRKLLLMSLVLGLLGITLFGCADSGSPSTPANLTMRVNLLTATDGTLSPTGQEGEYVLVLKDVLPDALWYTDRPARESGEETVEYFVSAWPTSYGQVDPNAVMTFYLPQSETTEGIFVRVKDPEYNSNTGTLSFQATMLNSTLNEKPESILAFENPVMSVLNNVSEQNEMSSFAQYCETATLEPTATEGVYILSLDELDEEVFWTDNAPGHRSQIGGVDFFVEQWDKQFVDSPPNASIHGTTDNGEFGLYLLTITDPKHDKEHNRVEYTATLLGEEAGSLSRLDSTMLFIDAGACSSGKQKTVTITNQQGSSATVNINFAADSEITSKDLGFCQGSDLNCSFTLDAKASKTIPNPDYKYLNFTLAFNAPVGCGSTKTEVTVNNPKWYDTMDVSVVDGFNEKIQINANGTQLGPPNGKLGNQKVFGVYPYGCDGCASVLNPPCGDAGQGECKGGTQYNPDVKCHYQMNQNSGTIELILLS
ncbi:hypothetical protein ES703_96904 [subsurface metagenome]